MRNVLITGATGFLGGAALSYILKEKSECQLLLLTRGESTKHAVMRVNENLRKFQLAETLINRISSDNILLGDLTAPDFFLKIVVSMPLLTSSIVRISPHPVIIRLSGQGMWRGCSGLSIVWARPLIETFPAYWICRARCIRIRMWARQQTGVFKLWECDCPVQLGKQPHRATDNRMLSRASSDENRAFHRDRADWVR